MTRAATALVLMLGACGDPAALPERDLLITLESGATDVRLGEGFALDVVRTWQKDLAPDPWDDALLWPLDVRTVGVVVEDSGRHVRETRRLRAYAFTSGELDVPGPVLTATPTAGGAVRTARAGGLTLSVSAELDPAEPGAPELPGGPLTPGSPWRLWSVVGAAAVLALVLVVRARRPRPAAAPAVPATPPPSPERLASERLARLRTDSDPTAVHIGVANALREFLGTAFGVGTPQATTEELVPLASGVLAPERAATLRRVLVRCDRVKFAARRPTARDAERVLDDALGFVGGADAR